MMLRAILAFLALPTLLAGVFPWFISKLPATDTFQWPYSVVPMVLGGGILLASVISFYRHDRGTLAPWDPPKHLVVQDLYRFNRNPMHVGVGLLTLGCSVHGQSVELRLFRACSGHLPPARRALRGKGNGTSFRRRTGGLSP